MRPKSHKLQYGTCATWPHGFFASESASPAVALKIPCFLGEKPCFKYPDICNVSNFAVRRVARMSASIFRLPKAVRPFPANSLHSSGGNQGSDCRPPALFRAKEWATKSRGRIKTGTSSPSRTTISVQLAPAAAPRRAPEAALRSLGSAAHRTARKPATGASIQACHSR